MLINKLSSKLLPDQLYIPWYTTELSFINNSVGCFPNFILFWQNELHVVYLWQLSSKGPLVFSGRWCFLQNLEDILYELWVWLHDLRRLHTLTVSYQIFYKCQHNDDSTIRTWSGNSDDSFLFWNSSKIAFFKILSNLKISSFI